MNLEERNYYEVLGLKRSAEADEIEAAYHRLYAIYSPDGLQPDSDHCEHIQRAYEVLRDPKRRAFFDSILAEVKPEILASLQVSTQELAISNEEQMVYLLAKLYLNEEQDKRTVLPLNLCLVIDHSSSMRGERLEQVKLAVKLLLPKLASEDSLALVGFSDWASVIVPSGPVGDQLDPTVKIDAVEAAGGTEIFQGLLAGMNEVRKATLSKHKNVLVLLTDGRTYGDEEQCLRLADEAASLGITFHAFGIGVDWDDRFLDALVDVSGGLVDYIDSPEKIVVELRDRLSNLGHVRAREVTLLADWPQTITYHDALRLTPYARSLERDGDRFLLGDIEGNQGLSIVMALLVKPQPISTRIRVPLQFQAELPGEGTQSIRAQVGFSVVAEPALLNPPEEVARAVQLMTLFNLNERARLDAESGSLDAAEWQMRNLATRLFEAGESELAMQADLEAQRLARTGQLSAHGRKRLKYGTRALTQKKLRWGRNESV